MIGRVFVTPPLSGGQRPPFFLVDPMPDNEAIHRILDANMNRAREALRVMEEFARFVLEDAGLSAAIKGVRHRLGTSVPRQVAESGVTVRDIAGDVGRETNTPDEVHRSDAKHVAVAASKRLSEALRSIEEYAKAVEAAWAETVKQLRYEGYNLEKRLTLVARAVERLSTVRLYVLVTEEFCRTDWFATTEAVLEGGADAIQLREKGLPDAELLRRAKRLAALCRKRGAIFIVNDRVDVAALSRADGVHLGQDDLSPSDARQLLPPGAIVGVSTHTPEQVLAAAETVPDYIAVGPMYASVTKPQEFVPGPALLTAARRQTAIPLVAIGGITVENVAEVVMSAPCIVCVCQAVVGAADAKAAVASLRRVLDCNRQ